MIELARWSCPKGHVFDVWLEDGEPESERATRCPECPPMQWGSFLVYACGEPDEEETELWRA